MIYKDTDLMSDLIKLIESKWVSFEQIEQLAKKLELKDVTEKIAFFRELKYLMSAVPVEVFDSEEHRQTIIDAAQHALDNAVEQEEDEINGLG